MEMQWMNYFRFVLVAALLLILPPPPPRSEKLQRPLV
jgi:hypothetical protein